MHGLGIFTWPDGRKYEGQYINGKKEGHGVLTRADGCQFIGQFKNDKMHEEETYRTEEGEIKKGEWIDYKDYKVFVEYDRNFALQHKEDPSQTIQVEMRLNSEGGFDWVGLPDSLK